MSETGRSPLEVIRQFQQKLEAERIPIGFVFATRYKVVVRRFIENTKEKYDSLAAVQCFFDDTQQDDCIAFYDRETLRLYLDRERDPIAWCRHLIKGGTRK